MKEIWKPIKGYEGYYKISNLGRIKNIRTNTFKTISIGKIGYPVVYLYKDGSYKTYYVHRLLAETFIPNIDNKLQVNHIDGNKTNNSLNNLEWITYFKNIQHAYDINLNILQKILSEEEIKDFLLNKFMKGESITSIANNKNIKLTTLSFVF